MPVRALLHYALEVPDQTVGETFYRTFGLVGQPARDGAVHLRPGDLGRACTLLYGGPRKRLHHLAFGAPGGEYEAVRESIRRAGVREVDPPRARPMSVLGPRPDGDAVNVLLREARTPARSAATNSGQIQREAQRGLTVAGLCGAVEARPRAPLLYVDR